MGGLRSVRERHTTDRQHAGCPLALADDLGRLIDDMITRKMDWAQLDGLVPDQFDQYWQFTLDFLKIARDFWPSASRKAARSMPPSGAIG